MHLTNPHRPDGPCERARAAAVALAEADARCTATTVGKDTAYAAYREAFRVYCAAQEECTKERMRSRQ